MEILYKKDVFFLRSVVPDFIPTFPNGSSNLPCDLRSPRSRIFRHYSWALSVGATIANSGDNTISVLKHFRVFGASGMHRPTISMVSFQLLS
jgi:hypothetical protein